ncbi:MAG TPA: HU family DNA-binding protein [Xanthobacteraceae bacterium]|nr:HU family DNA-binding protein [Xanthobacteraceae bacterium]
MAKDHPMTKNELIAQVSERTQLNRNDATKAVEATFDVITGALKHGDEVKLIGFGSFTVAQRKAREGRNPRTGEPVQIAASKAPKFTAGKGLKDAVNFP